MRSKLILAACLAVFQYTANAQLMVEDLSSLFRSFDEPSCMGLPDIFTGSPPMDLGTEIAMSLFGE
jgi:hypothetical protein